MLHFNFGLRQNHTRWTLRGKQKMPVAKYSRLKIEGQKRLRKPGKIERLWRRGKRSEPLRAARRVVDTQACRQYRIHSYQYRTSTTGHCLTRKWIIAMCQHYHMGGMAMIGRETVPVVASS
jgi:hypothetical protein